MTELTVLDHWLLVLGGLAVSLLGAAHALFNTRDSRSAVAWIAVCLMWPVVGVLIYLLLGKNRIHTRARKLHEGSNSDYRMTGQFPRDGGEKLPADLVFYEGLSCLGAAASLRPLLSGNAVYPLHNGDAAYPAMLDAIGAARESVFLCTYIFDVDDIGRQFIDALADAVARGLQVRVLVDGVGEKYSFPTVSRRLRVLGVPVARYLPPRLFPPGFSINLRNHRKILVVDGELAFTGGMNIRQGHCSGNDCPDPAVVDLHFRLLGPVVGQLLEVFTADWRFSSDLAIDPPHVIWDSRALPGEAMCRVISDGPDDDQDRLVRVMVGAVSTARSSVVVVSPYFLPPRELAIALQTAADRGVEVTVVLPQHNNLPYVKWAMNHNLEELAASGIRVYFFQGPFMHTKLFLVDNCYLQLGSANIDPRSLRLNFEVMVEVYDRALAGTLARHVADCVARSTRLDPVRWASRSPLGRLRDGIMWLFSPYL